MDRFTWLDRFICFVFDLICSAENELPDEDERGPPVA